jgi:hypothetical protein
MNPVISIRASKPLGYSIRRLGASFFAQTHEFYSLHYLCGVCQGYPDGLVRYLAVMNLGIAKILWCVMFMAKLGIIFLLGSVKRFVVN